MNKSEFQNLMTRISEAYGERLFKLSKEKLQVWYEELKDLDYQLATTAIRKHITTSEFPPSIADIYREYAKVKPDEFDIDKSFSRVISFYPSGYVDKGAVAVYKSLLLCAKDKQNREDRICNLTKWYVRDCEHGEADMKLLSEWLSGLRIMEMR